MCLAVPMQVREISDWAAVVELEGIQREVRLDIVDRRPVVGDYVIVHAGFAIHTLEPEEARINLRLMQEMADGLDRQDRNNPQ